MGDTAIPQDKSNIQKYLGVSICIVLCCAKLLLPYLTLCDSVDHRLPGAFVHGILQARILRWFAIFYSRRSSWPRDQTHVSCVSCIGRRVFYHCAMYSVIVCKCTAEVLGRCHKELTMVTWSELCTFMSVCWPFNCVLQHCGISALAVHSCASNVKNYFLISSLYLN